MNDLIKFNSLFPSTYNELKNFAEMYSLSSLCPPQFKNKPEDVQICMIYGYEIGLSISQSPQSIAVINGRPTVWGDSLKALVMNNSKCEWIKETMKDGVAYCTVKRKGYDEHTQTFSIDDAKKANLWGKQGPWTQYPNRMLMMRARGFALRDIFPDVLKGIISTEEAQDIPPEKDITPVRDYKVGVMDLNNPDPVNEGVHPFTDEKVVDYDMGEVTPDFKGQNLNSLGVECGTIEPVYTGPASGFIMDSLLDELDYVTTESQMFNFTQKVDQLSLSIGQREMLKEAAKVKREVMNSFNASTANHYAKMMEDIKNPEFKDVERWKKEIKILDITDEQKADAKKAYIKAVKRLKGE